MQAVLVGLGVNGDVFDVQVFAGANYANGDLSAVCDQNFMYHLTFLSYRFLNFTLFCLLMLEFCFFRVRSLRTVFKFAIFVIFVVLLVIFWLFSLIYFYILTIVTA
jgi:hypothetical protein